EAVYGGKEQEGMYVETDSYKPRSPYGESKVISEKDLINSGLPYLITRGHRHVGISKNFMKSKQFLNILQKITNRENVHIDSKKIFTPVLINNACDIFAHHIENNSNNQNIINMGIDKATNFYDFMIDLAKEIGLDAELIKGDGNESGWPLNSSLCMKKLHELGYPFVTYDQLLKTIKKDVT
ncbi:MAG: sugar nucleotide-binding protein, partial [Patescibacteria group bacterium]